jgi:acetoin utilization protein AcuC
MEAYHAGFSEGDEYASLLNESNPFRRPEAYNSIRLRSWAIHDGILGEPFTNVTMYKRIGISAGVNTTPGCDW